MYVSRESAEQTQRRLLLVIVVCGSNSARDGIFDYWAVPQAE